ncbi:MAG TPA: hypothetical protein VIU12_24845 [Chryseolinea sp.]
MSHAKTLYKTTSALCGLVIATSLCCLSSCKKDPRLDKLVLHENPLIKIRSKPEVLLDHLNNPAAPCFDGDRIIFAESGKGILYELKNGKAIPLIEGFGTDNYGGYTISVLGLTVTPDKSWLVAAAQDSGHIFLFDASTFPTTVAKGREIEMHRTESTNPFGILLTKGGILVATGGTKAVYQGPWDRINPNPLKPVFDVASGVEGMAEDAQTGDVFGAVVGTGKKDGSLIRWRPEGITIEPKTVATGFSNLVGVTALANGLLLLLEFGDFGTPETGRLSVLDPKNLGKIHPLISGLDAPSAMTLGTDNTLVIATFGKEQEGSGGMIIQLKIDSNQE